PMLKAYLNGVQLNTLHPSFNNQSKLNYLIEKNRRSKYPHRQDIMGVIHEFIKNHQNAEDPYIRFIDNGQLIILCLKKEQAIALSELKYFEIDTSFKRVQGVYKEWEINAFIEKYSKTLCFARVFVKNQTIETYQHIFEELFTIIEQDIGHSFYFQHIHGQGLGCILADAEKAQAIEVLSALNQLENSNEKETQ
ncbi:18261_t:CDS:2, partial [Racocetra persica]